MVEKVAMDIGIMSMQRIYNYGSSLQSYALRRLLEEASGGADVRFIDYRPGDPVSRTGVGSRGRVDRVFQKLREYNAVAVPSRDKVRFFNHKRRYGSVYHPMIGVDSAFASDTDVGLQVIGSDEVFNCAQSNINVGFSPDLFGIGSRANTLVSYAASFGNTTVGDIDAAGIRQTLASGFERFSSISVRDQNSADVVADLLGADQTSIHLDPTLVYNLMNCEDRIPAERLWSTRYMIVYGYSGRMTDAENKAVRAYADTNDLKVLSFGGLQECADAFIDCDPFSLLAYFRDAEAVVTDTFHGTIFGIINSVPFVSIVRKSENGRYGNEEKLGYLLDRLGLSLRRLRSAGELRELLSESIDYDAVRDIRALEAARSRGYLLDACRLAKVGGSDL